MKKAAKSASKLATHPPGCTSDTMPQKLVCRARIILMWAQGAGVTATVQATGKTNRRRQRYLTLGVAGLERDATRPGRKPPLDAATVKRVVDMTLHEKPPGGTHGSARKLAEAVGLSHSSVQRIWKAHGLKPHLTRRFKLSNDPKFCEKVQDIVGLCLDPPACSGPPPSLEAAPDPRQTIGCMICFASHTNRTIPGHWESFL